MKLTHSTQEALLQGLSEGEKERLLNKLLRRRHGIDSPRSAMRETMAKRKRYAALLHEKRGKPLIELKAHGVLLDEIKRITNKEEEK